MTFDEKQEIMDEKQEIMDAIKAFGNVVAGNLQSLSTSSPEKFSVGISDAGLQNSASRLASLAQKKSQKDLHQDEENGNSWHKENEISNRKSSESGEGRVCDTDICDANEDEKECVILTETADPERTVTNIDTEDHTYNDNDENIIDHTVPSSALPPSSNTHNSDIDEEDDDDDDDLPRHIFNRTFTKTSDKKDKSLSISQSTLKTSSSPIDKTKHLYNGKSSPATEKIMSDFKNPFPLSQPSQQKDMKIKKDQKSATNKRFQIDFSSANCSMDNYNITLPRKKTRQAANNFPFDLLERGLDAASFISRFKIHINKQLKNIYDSQRNSTTYMEWSKPIPIKVLPRVDTNKRPSYQESESEACNSRDRLFGKTIPSDSEEIYDETAVDKVNGDDDELSVLYDKNCPVETKLVPSVQCPICGKMFSNTEIENHASECDRFEGKDADDPMKVNFDDFPELRTRHALRNLYSA